MNRYSNSNSILHAGTFAAPVVPLMLMLAIYSPPYQAGFGEVCLLWLTGLGINFGMIVIHELGHVVAARLVGIEIAHITIGHWRKVISFVIDTTTVTVRAAPASGYVLPKPTLHFYSVPRLAVFLLAGVVAEGLVAGFAVYARPDSEVLSFGEMLIAFSHINFVCTGGYHVVSNLLPTMGWVGGEKMASDGLQLLRLWTQRRERPAQRQFLVETQEVAALIKAKRFPDALRLLENLIRQYPTNHELTQLSGSIYVECGALDKAEEVWRDLLKQPIGSSSLAIAAMDSLSCLPLYYGQMHLLNEADAWTSMALKRSPDAITLKGTRGSVLIELGRVDEGMAFLKEVIKRTDCPVDRVICSAYLSKGYTLKGSSAEARLWMEKARAIDSEHVVVKRLGKELPSLTTEMIPD